MRRLSSLEESGLDLAGEVSLRNGAPARPSGQGQRYRCQRHEIDMPDLRIVKPRTAARPRRTLVKTGQGDVGQGPSTRCGPASRCPGLGLAGTAPGPRRDGIHMNPIGPLAVGSRPEGRMGLPVKTPSPSRDPPSRCEPWRGSSPQIILLRDGGTRRAPVLMYRRPPQDNPQLPAPSPLPHYLRTTTIID